MEIHQEARRGLATAEQCRTALEKLTGRIAEMDPQARADHMVNRSLSCTVEDLGITFVTQLGPDGAGPVTDADATTPRANIRFFTHSDDLLDIADDLGRFGRAWLTGRVKVQASVFDLLRLRKLL